MSNVAGKAVLQVGVDGSQAKAGLQDIKREVQGTTAAVSQAGAQSTRSFGSIGKAADDAGGRVTSSGQRVLRSLEQQANRLSMTTAEYAKLRAEQAGVAAQAAPMIARIEAATTRATSSMGMSVAAQAAAMRMVPAQFTDIVVGLQGGQNPMTVLLQQGGQLKDMFGGLVPAARALGGYVAGLINPFTLAAGAIAAFGIAAYQGSNEAGAFQRTLILTGNQAGVTADQLSTMARSLGQIEGNRGKAAAALTEIAAVGRIPGDMLAKVGQAALGMQEVTGKAIEDTVKEFVSLGEKPTEAIAKLNQSQSFLTTEIYSQISALEQQGRQQDAARLAQETYANATIERVGQVRETLGTLERGWNTITSAAAAAWNAMKDVGREDTQSDELAGLERDLRQREDNLRIAEGIGATPSKKELERLAAARQAVETKRAEIKASEDAAQAKADEARRTREAAEALAAWNKQGEQVQTRAQQRAKEEREAMQLADKLGLGEEEREKRRALIREKYKDQKGPEIRDAAATSMLAQLREQESALTLQLNVDTKLTAQARARVEFERQIADLKDKKVLTAQQKSLLADEHAIRAQLTKNERLGAEIQAREALLKMQERGRQIEQSIASARESRQEQYERTLGAMGQGDVVAQRVQAQQALRREFQRYQDQLNRATPKDLLGTEQHREQVSAIQAALQSALAEQEAYYARVDEMQSSWALGAQQALASYVDSSRNAYRMVASAATGWISGFEDRLTQAVTTGKARFSDLANSVINDLIRIQIRQNVTGPLAGMLGSLVTTAVGSMSADWTTTNTSNPWSLESLGVLGQRAAGGPTVAGGLYEVNEQGPELYTEGGRTYLMAGSQGGYVTPASQGGTTGGGVQVSVSIQQGQGANTAATPGYEQFAQDVGQYIDQRFKQLQAQSHRQGGLAWQQRNGRA